MVSSRIVWECRTALLWTWGMKREALSLARMSVPKGLRKHE